MDTDTQPKPTLNEGIAEEIRALLARRRLSASDLARMTGMTQRAISRRLTGEKVIDADDMERIAAVLGVDITDLLPREGRVVTHIGAPRVQSTVPKVSLPGRPRTFGPRGREVPSSRIRRPELIVSAAA